MRRKRSYTGGGLPSEEAILRIRRVTVGVSLVVSILIFRLWTLQFLEGERYSKESIQNYEKRVEIASRRGSILDRNLDILAQDVWNYNLLLDKGIPEPEELSRLLVSLSEITGYSEETLRRNLTRKPPDRKGRRLIVQGIPFRTMVAVEERSIELPGIVTERVPGRDYPCGDLAAHVLGYVGEIDRDRLDKWRDRGYRQGDRIGKRGVELGYEESLRGKDGVQIVQLDSFGRQRNVLRVEAPPQQGQDVVLNIDLGLQRKAEEILGASHGVIIALDPRTGGVLAMASSPRFDPNTYRQDLGRLWNDDNRPLTHRAVVGLYAPGSVFKIFESFGLVDEGIVDENTEVFCSGQYAPFGGNQIWRCWRRYGHGRTGLVNSLRISCDVFFYKMAGQRMGITKIADWARKFHLGMPTQVDLPYEKAEPFPSRALFKARGKPWYEGYTINASIGQGDILVTPLQTAAAIAAVANGGTIYQPQVAAGVIQSTSPRLQVEPIQPKVLGTIEASEKAWRLVRQGIWEVVNAYNGTGRRCKIEGFPMMGKTGTAEVATKEPHAWYVCFGPVDGPEYGDRIPEIVVVTLLEHGGHGGESASPLAKELLEFYLSGGHKTIV